MQYFTSSNLLDDTCSRAPHSSPLAWKIPWTEEPGKLQSVGLLRVGHNWAISLSGIGEGNGNPLHCSCLENPRDGGAGWAAVNGVAQSRTRLKRLSSSSSPFSTGLQCPYHTARVMWQCSVWLKEAHEAFGVEYGLYFIATPLTGDLKIFTLSISGIMPSSQPPEELSTF